MDLSNPSEAWDYIEQMWGIFVSEYTEIQNAPRLIDYLRKNHPEISAELDAWDATVQQLLSLGSQAWNAAQDVFTKATGFGDMTIGAIVQSNPILSGRPALGVAPWFLALIATAVLIAAAALYNFIQTYGDYQIAQSRVMNAVHDGLASGQITPEQAADVLNKITPPPAAGPSWSSNLVTLGLILGGIYFWNEYEKRHAATS